ncbi:MAG: hypothetical protein ABF723_02740 [Lentilactobacillus hilgardii]|uniref:hypothetical protein n=1 Tax=Lentilactobacillus hilgardii TaxID=1588 RepID=UPI001CC206A5|nr:hypothetical protein [Lentilactobacillus hilgardii]MBZ2200779.1 hypothetical protein [Lentilactobacillus hilgardii]MBZ2203778.1 hypothetical protein [Lentilactobacillus hilgardii]
MNNRKKGGNFLVILLIIIVVDALFIGYSMIKKHNQKNSQASTIQTTVIMNAPAPTIKSILMS